MNHHWSSRGVTSVPVRYPPRGVSQHAPDGQAGYHPSVSGQTGYSQHDPVTSSPVVISPPVPLSPTSPSLRNRQHSPHSPIFMSQCQHSPSSPSLRSHSQRSPDSQSLRSHSQRSPDSPNFRSHQQCFTDSPGISIQTGSVFVTDRYSPRSSSVDTRFQYPPVRAGHPQMVQPASQWSTHPISSFRSGEFVHRPGSDHRITASYSDNRNALSYSDSAPELSWLDDYYMGHEAARGYTEEHRQSQQRFTAMENTQQHKQSGMNVSIYGEFGVPMDYDLPLEDSVPVDYGLPEDYFPPPTGSPNRVPDIPTPDYDPDTPVADRKSFVFVEKFRGVISNINSIEELYSDFPEPVPDYQDEDSNDFPPPPPPITDDNMSTSETSTGGPTIIGIRNGAASSPEDEGELIQPKKLVNPCVSSRERQALHKELLLNYKLGKDVLQKPELNKILAKRKDTQKRKEWEEQQANKRTSLELRLEEQANKLKEKEENEKMKPIAEDDKAPEFMQMHRRITNKTPTSPPT